MFSLASPLYLLGLLSLPLIRRLHRYSAGDNTMFVSALFLWPPPAPSSPAGRNLGKPDPRWRLRALIIASLILSLAGPKLEVTGERSVDVWVDDSLSMQTRENGITRLQSGLAKLDHALREAGATQARLYSLINPAVKLNWQPDSVHRGGIRWPVSPLTINEAPHPPAAALMSLDHEQWLITDDANPRLNAWADTAPISHILQTGKAHDNAAITRLAIRPNLAKDGAAWILVTVHNLGDHDQSRILSLYDGNLLRDRRSLQLPSHSQRDIRFKLPLSTATLVLRAVLTPADALVADDSLHLESADLGPVLVRLDEGCPNPVRIALQAHPRIRIYSTQQGHSDLRVICDAAPLNTTVNVPTLHIHLPADPRPIDYTPFWSSSREGVPWPPLQRSWLYDDPAALSTASGKPLLGTADHPLIVASQTTPPVIDVFLDMQQPSLIRQPAYPALIDGLITSLLGRPLLDEVFTAARSARESRIAPLPLSDPATTASPHLHSHRMDLSPLPALVAALLLIADLILLRKPIGLRRRQLELDPGRY